MQEGDYGLRSALDLLLSSLPGNLETYFSFNRDSESHLRYKKMQVCLFAAFVMFHNATS